MWEPMEDIYIRNYLDFASKNTLPTVRPSCGRGKRISRPNLHEMKFPKALQELIEKNVQKKTLLDRGKSLKHMSLSPAKTESDSDSPSKSAQALPPGDNCDNENSVIIDNLPKDVSSEDIRSLLELYGEVLNVNITRHENLSSCNVKLDSVPSCEWAVSCLNDTDLFPEDEKTVSCVPAWL